MTGNIQSASDDFGDLPKGYAFFGHAVITGPCRPFFESEPEQMSGIEAMHCRPAVEALTDVCGSSFLTRHIDEDRHKAVIAIAADRWPEASRSTRALHAPLPRAQLPQTPRED